MALLIKYNHDGWDDRTDDLGLNALANELAGHFEVGYARCPIIMYNDKPCVMMSKEVKSGTTLEIANELIESIATINAGQTKVVFLYEIIITQTEDGPKTRVRFGCL